MWCCKAQTVQQCLENGIRHIFYQTGQFIANYPYVNIGVSVLLLISCSTGLLKLKEKNDIRTDFTPVGSRSRYEQSVSEEFFNEKGQPFWMFIAIMAVDGGSLLRPAYTEAVLDLKAYMETGINVTHKGSTYYFIDLCGSNCDSNDAIHIFLNSFQTHRQNPNIQLTYPTMELFGESLYVANNLYGVQQDNRTHQVSSAQVIVLYFRAIDGDADRSAVLRLWEFKVLDFATSFHHPLINMTVSSHNILSHEIRRNGITVIPYLSISFLVILLFTVGTSLRVDPVRSKPWEALIGVLCPVMAVATSFGLLMHIGAVFLSIVSITPFLILAIGVDDAFIMLHAWHKTERSQTPKERLSHALSEAGPSITITSLTNALSFGVGALSTTPAITVFCTFTATAIAVDYLYQIFFFSSILFLGGKNEADGRNAYYGLCIGSPKPPEQKSQFAKRMQASVDQLKSWSVSKFRKLNSLFLTWQARIAIVSLLAVYWTTAAWGCSRMTVGMAPEKLFLRDSPLNYVTYVIDQFMYREASQFSVLVNKPGDLRNKQHLQTVLDFVKEFESTPHSMGPQSTSFWLRPYLGFIAFQDAFDTGFDMSDTNFSYTYMMDFLEGAPFGQWQHYLNLAPDACSADRPRCIDSFFFTTGYRNATSWALRTSILSKHRQICDEYSTLNATVLEDLSMYVDQISTIGQLTAQTVLIALFCMMLVCVVFIPNLVSIVCATLSVLSINTGVFGYLTLWSVELDFISMATILMSIGFSVDFTAHISYHFYKGVYATTEERLWHAMHSIAWPMLQAGLSTLLSTFILSIVQTYIMEVFLKTVFLVVTLGLLHGLVILPAVLSALPFSKNSPLSKSEGHSSSHTDMTHKNGQARPTDFWSIIGLPKKNRVEPLPLQDQDTPVKTKTINAQESRVMETKCSDLQNSDCGPDNLVLCAVN